MTRQDIFSNLQLKRFTARTLLYDSMTAQHSACECINCPLPGSKLTVETLYRTDYKVLSFWQIFCESSRQRCP